MYDVQYNEQRTVPPDIHIRDSKNTKFSLSLYLYIVSCHEIVRYSLVIVSYLTKSFEKILKMFIAS